MHTCFLNTINIINICPNNFAIQLEWSVARCGEGGEARLPRDSVYFEHWQKRGELLENTTSRKLRVDLWPTTVESSLAYLIQFYISCSFSHLKK